MAEGGRLALRMLVPEVMIPVAISLAHASIVENNTGVDCAAATRTPDANLAASAKGTGTRQISCTLGKGLAAALFPISADGVKYGRFRYKGDRI